MANNPLTDAALAELDRLHAAATPREWQINGSHIYGPDPKRSLIAQTLDWPTNSRDAIAALHNAYPALRQRLTNAESRLAEAERERDAYKSQCSALLDAITIQEQAQMACDSQQRREGTVEAYERAADMLSVFPGGVDAEEMMRDAAHRLREGK